MLYLTARSSSPCSFNVRGGDDIENPPTVLIPGIMKSTLRNKQVTCEKYQVNERLCHMNLKKKTGHMKKGVPGYMKL